MQAGDYIREMAAYVLVSLPLILIVRFIFHKISKRRLKELNWFHEAGVIVMFMVFVGIASQTIIPQHINVNYSSINLVPFNKFAEIRESAQRGIFSYIVNEVIGNIALFVPVGFLLPLLWKRFEKIWAVLLSCLSISLAIEIIQLGISLRATDVDDLIMNVLGGIVGYFIYALIRRLTKSKTDKFKLAEKKPVAIG